METTNKTLAIHFDGAPITDYVLAHVTNALSNRPTLEVTDNFTIALNWLTLFPSKELYTVSPWRGQYLLNCSDAATGLLSRRYGSFSTISAAHQRACSLLFPLHHYALMVRDELFFHTELATVSARLSAVRDHATFSKLSADWYNDHAESAVECEENEENEENEEDKNSAAVALLLMDSLNTFRKRFSLSPLSAESLHFAGVASGNDL